jgi:hypothetical protein
MKFAKPTSQKKFILFPFVQALGSAPIIEFENWFTGDTSNR